ncbi:MAG TPA: hypothetical protein VJ966_03485 [Actinomycetes bacterium]|nr:hypothetical protein [Actinomycetes bacterium]
MNLTDHAQQMTTDQPTQGRRRLIRNPADPTFQGDGWRWTLSLVLPRWLTVLVLTEAQWHACYREWKATQEAHLGRPLDPFETVRGWERL